jgi:hypothetical protein
MREEVGSALLRSAIVPIIIFYPSVEVQDSMIMTHTNLAL